MTEALFQMSWPYYELRADGHLYDEDGARFSSVKFADADEAQSYLERENIRGDVLS